ncbi:MAG: alkaline phosphatase family protein [Verrucomicrobia bacterium]|nr:alkaline phosphatase family protein [Verrucomicrobiota bacterium]
MATQRKLLVIDVAALGWKLVREHRSSLDDLEFQRIEPPFPAVTCTVQASFRTATPAGEHGMICNGVYVKQLRQPMFWEQSSNLVHGPRIWDEFRANGGTVGMMFWQQSLGEEVDMVLSPRPIHKHSGGMIQDCYSQPSDLYDRLCSGIGRKFNLMHYWGPLASRRSSDWIVDATCAVLKMDSAPDVLLTYIPHLDYNGLKSGHDNEEAVRDLGIVIEYLQRLKLAASEAGYEILIFGDYSMDTVNAPAVLPNLILKDAGLFKTRTIRGMTYPDFFYSDAFAMVDHEVAHIYTSGEKATRQAMEALKEAAHIGGILDREAQKEFDIDHDNAGDLVLVADPGSWFAYPWWTDKKEAPDYATHIDIHNKPGFDPCELFFGWPPPSITQDASKVGGSHGRMGAGAEAACASSIEFEDHPATLIHLAASVRNWLTANEHEQTRM